MYGLNIYGGYGPMAPQKKQKDEEKVVTFKM